MVDIIFTFVSQVALIILLLLTVVTLNIGSQTSLPQVSYLKAIDIWMFTCVSFICAVLGVVGAGKEGFIHCFMRNYDEFDVKNLANKPTKQTHCQ